VDVKGLILQRFFILDSRTVFPSILMAFW